MIKIYLYTLLNIFKFLINIFKYKINMSLTHD